MKLSLMVEGETKIALVRREMCTCSLARILHLRNQRQQASFDVSLPCTRNRESLSVPPLFPNPSPIRLFTPP